MKAAILPDRGIVRISGDDARTFLNGLLTVDVTTVTVQNPRYTALLTPQGKIVADGILVQAPDTEGGFLLDCPRELAGELLQKLKFYKLRAKVSAEDVTSDREVLAIWDGVASSVDGILYDDPRLPALGQRAIVASEQVAQIVAALGARLTDAGEYERHRIALGIPQGGIDFGYGDAFPHEADMDQLHAIDFAKGCYVGQEVVSRIEHRGTARNRIVPVTFEGAAPGAGIPVMAGERQVGTTGSAAGSQGLAMLRLDRIGDALAAGQPLTAGESRLHPRKPDWARFAWPGGKAAE